MDEFIYRSGVLGTAVTGGNIAIWLGLTFAVLCVGFYWGAMIRAMRNPITASPGNGKETSGKQTNGKKSKAPLPDEDPKAAALGKWGRRFFFATAACIVIGSVSLWTLIFTQAWNVQYIWKNTSSDLAFGFRFASFWGDQEGTFFLWGLYNTILGSVLLWKARADERWVMPFFALINVSLFLLLTFMNPFWLHSAAEVKANLVEMGAPPEMMAFLPTNTMQHLAYYFGWGQYVVMRDGKGLNESLQNFWMVIHPPTLFLGYSSMIIPACFALGALMKRDYDTWVTRATPWLMFSWTVLATGIFMGAYWAYETLGWGGYWSWDPVENSSLIPWLVGTTLLHGLLAQRNRGNLKQANLFIGILAGFAVLLGSFLVRSGVLSENSVHSFASPQASVFATLLGVMIVWFVMSMAIWLWRYKDIQGEIAYETLWERHFGFFLGVIILSAISLVVMFGVTLPIWQPWLPGSAAGEKTGVDYTFYNKALLPICFVLVGLMALTPLMPWKQANEKRPMKPFNQVCLWACAALSIAFVLSAVWAMNGAFKTQNDPAYASFGGIVVLALITNTVCLKRASGGGLLNAGSWLSHIGFIVMLAGVMITSRFNTTHLVQKAELGEPHKILGREFTWRGQKPADGPTDRERLLIDMKMADGKVMNLAPKLFVSKISNQTMAWPQIIHEYFGGAWGDIYVEPTGVDTTGAVTAKDLAKDSEKPAEMPVQHKASDPTDFVIATFHGIDTSEMQRELRRLQSTDSGGKHGESKPFHVYGDVRLMVNGVEQRLRPAVKMTVGAEGLQQDPIPMPVAGLNQPTPYRLYFKTNLNPSALTADLELRPDEKVYHGYFTVLHVPGIHILWWGVYLMIAGGGLTWRRRTQLARRPATSKATKAPVAKPASEAGPVGEPGFAGAE